MLSNKILSVNNLVTSFETPRGRMVAVKGVSFELNKGEALGIVGESGCGKSVTSLSILRLVRGGTIESGEILFRGTDLLKLPEKEMRQIRGNRIAMIFQEPMTTLNPSFTIGWQIGEAFRLHSKLSGKEIKEKTIDVLRKVRIPDPEKRLGDYPHQFSGGMRQRVLIAIALACQPEVLIADEPTTALDVTIQVDIIDLLSDLQKSEELSMLFISHNLNLVGECCDRIMVMYAGYVVEVAASKELFESHYHPYTEGLIKAIPSKNNRERLISIPGEVKLTSDNDGSCGFYERCVYCQQICKEKLPSLIDIGNGHLCRCHFAIERSTHK